MCCEQEGEADVSSGVGTVCRGGAVLGIVWEAASRHRLLSAEGTMCCRAGRAGSRAWDGCRAACCHVRYCGLCREQLPPAPWAAAGDRKPGCGWAGRTQLWARSWGWHRAQWGRTEQQRPPPAALLVAQRQAGPHQMPRASGQSRAIPAAVRSGDTGLSKRKWSCRDTACQRGTWRIPGRRPSGPRAPHRG